MGSLRPLGSCISLSQVGLHQKQTLRQRTKCKWFILEMKGTREQVGTGDVERKATNTGCASEQITSVDDQNSILQGA